jgi:tight adherence protein B
MSQLPNALDVIKSSLEAGHSLHRALQVLVGEFSEPLGPEFRSAIEQTQIGLSLPRALEEMLRRVPVDDLRLMVVAVKVQSQVGSSLAPIIGKLADLVRARQRLKLQIQALTAQLRFSGVVVALLPAVVLAISSFAQPHYVHMLFHDAQGFMLFKAAVVMDIAAYFIIRRMMRLEY